VVFVGFSTIGKKVIYKGERGRLIGEVKNEVSVENVEGGQTFLNFIQCIEFEGGGCGIRFCYYKKRGDKWIFTNRPLSINLKTLKALLKKASREQWFPKLK
jgi:hypothetical protein